MAETEFIDAEAYQGGGFQQQFITFPLIALKHLERLAVSGSKEWAGGRWETRVRSVGSTVYSEKVYIPDSRAEYANTVDMLHDLLLPNFDTQMRTAAEKLNRESAAARSIERQLPIKRRLFQELSLLLKRLHYLEGKAHRE